MTVGGLGRCHAQGAPSNQEEKADYQYYHLHSGSYFGEQGIIRREEVDSPLPTWHFRLAQGDSRIPKGSKRDRMGRPLLHPIIQVGVAL